VHVLDVDEDNEGGPRSDSELLAGVTALFDDFTHFCFGLGRATLLLFQPSQVT
jgi:hypothetical protein